MLLERKIDLRIGEGYDVHRLEKGRPFILGGVHIDYDFGLLGHSDADVLLHAVADALLGAAALGDIGKHFPPGDERFLNISSRLLLKEVGAMLTGCKYQISNIDSTVILQRPKIAPYILQMRKNIADDLNRDIDKVSVKATTEEGLGFTGKGMGVAARAVALIKGKND